MKSLNDMAQEYLDNVAVLEKRIEELKQEERACRHQQTRIELRRRIYKLNQMVCEGRLLAFQMEHYYDKPKEGNAYAHKQTSKPKPAKRTRFNASGYRSASPAAAMHGRSPNAAPVSGLRAQLSGGNAAAGHRP